MANQESWLFVYMILMPVLAGLFLLTSICRFLMLWQKDNSPRSIAFALIYFIFFALFLFYSLFIRLPPLMGINSFVYTTTAGYVVMIFALVIGNWFEWRDLILFIQAREQAEHLRTLTLREAAEEPAVVLSAQTAPEMAQDDSGDITYSE